MIHWNPFHYEGVVHDLTHLHPKTVGFKKGEKHASNLLYADSRERRIFDFERYELSKYLPRIVADLPPRKCYHTGKGNFFSMEILNQRDGTKIEYDIFLKPPVPLGRESLTCLWGRE